jgi:hypothetical protein
LLGRFSCTCFFCEKQRTHWSVLQGAVYCSTCNVPFDNARALQALVARLDDEIESKSMLKSKLAAFQGNGFSATLSSTTVSLSTNLSTDGYDKVVAAISRIQLEQIEKERSTFEDARKVKYPEYLYNKKRGELLGNGLISSNKEPDVAASLDM